MESNTIDWAKNTPTYDGSHYNVFRSTYKNIRYEVKPLSSTYTVTAKDLGRIPMISYNIYGTTAYWRAILEYNGIRNPITDIYPGQILKLPDVNDFTNKVLGTDTTASSIVNDDYNNVTLTI